VPQFLWFGSLKKTLDDLFTNELNEPNQVLTTLLNLVMYWAGLLTCGSLALGSSPVIGGLGICGIHRGSLNSTKVWLFRSLVVTVTDRFKLGNRRADSHALIIQWVHVGDPLDVHIDYDALPGGNAYEYTIVTQCTYTLPFYR
jgi:hypothetical protein